MSFRIRAALYFLFLVFAAASQGGETLYNGIVLDSEWPPNPLPRNWPPNFFEIQASLKAPIPTPPYLTTPPAVIPIDVGRQLFVDSFLIESTTLKQTHHRPEYYAGNPVFGEMPYSGGVWYDPSDQLFKLWYNHGGLSGATSQDGIHWDKPQQVIADRQVHSSIVWLDLEEKDPARRFKAIWSASPWHYYARFSPDGIHWGDKSDLTPKSFEIGDRSTAFYNPFRQVWVFSTRHGWGGPRQRRYWEVKDLLKSPYWGNTEATRSPIWIGADAGDIRDPDMNIPCQLYNLDALAYESVMLGFFTIWRGDYGEKRFVDPNKLTERGKDMLSLARPKINEVCVGYSRDGWHWSRPDRRPFCPVSDEDNPWNWGNVQSVGGGCLVVGDRLYIYVSGRSRWKNQTGLAILRRDGFTSMDAGAEGGVLTTRPVRFAGKYLFVNVDAAGGELRAEALDEAGAVIAPFSADRCRAVSVNKTLQAVTWQGAEDLSALAGKPVKFRFRLKNGQLYAFWVSPEASGASHGYVGAGGPGFTAATDTVGVAAYQAADAPPAVAAAPAPRIWPLDGTFQNSVRVAIEVPLSLAAPGLVIRCTTDGTDPGANSALYAGPFVLTGSATVKARAFANDAPPSAVASAQFAIARDPTPATRFHGTPRGALPMGTVQAVLGVRTSRKAVCKYAAKPGVPFAEMPNTMTTADGREHAATVTGLRDGEVYVFCVKARNELGNANGDDLEIRFMVAPAAKPAPVRIELEAESGKLTAPMAALADAGASGGKYIASATAEQGTAAIPFTVPATDAYTIWARVIGVSSQADSFFVAVDGGGEDIFDLNEQVKLEERAKWHWIRVNDRDGYVFLAHETRLLPLASGEHVLNIRCRKADSRLDQVIITNDPAFKP